MKVNLVFNLPKEATEYKDAMDGAAYKRAVKALDVKLKKEYESGLNVSYSAAKFRQLLRDALASEGIS